MDVNVPAPQDVVDRVAQGKGMVTPVKPYFPLTSDFAREAVEAAYRAVMDEAMKLAAGRGSEAVDVMQRLVDALALRVRGG